MGQHVTLRHQPSRLRWGPGLVAAVLGACGLAAGAQTLDFDALPGAPAPDADVSFVAANGGSRTLGGVTFDAADNSDWEIVGSQYLAPSSASFFAMPHSGTYALAGNTFSGSDFFGTAYTGLTLTTTKTLTALYLGHDNDGGGATDADTLTLTAFGAGGDLAAVSVSLTGPGLSRLDTSTAFSTLSGIAGYRFETTAADALNEGFGRAYVIADDLTFGGAVTPVPEPSTMFELAAGLGLLAVSPALRRRRSGSRDRAPRLSPSI